MIPFHFNSLENSPLSHLHTGPLQVIFNAAKILEWLEEIKFIVVLLIFGLLFPPESIIIKVTQFHCKEIAEVKNIIRKLKITLWGSLWKDELNLGLLGNYANIPL